MSAKCCAKHTSWETDAYPQESLVDAASNPQYDGCNEPNRAYPATDPAPRSLRASRPKAHSDPSTRSASPACQGSSDTSRTTSAPSPPTSQQNPARLPRSTQCANPESTTPSL